MKNQKREKEETEQPIDFDFGQFRLQPILTSANSISASCPKSNCPKSNWPKSSTLVEKTSRKSTSQATKKEKHQPQNIFLSTENHNCSCPFLWTTSRWLERKNIGTCVEILRKGHRRGRSDPLLNQGYLGLHACCTSKSRPIPTNPHHRSDE